MVHPVSSPGQLIEMGNSSTSIDRPGRHFPFVDGRVAIYQSTVQRYSGLGEEVNPHLSWIHNK